MEHAKTAADHHARAADAPRGGRQASSRRAGVITRKATMTTPATTRISRTAHHKQAEQHHDAAAKAALDLHHAEADRGLT